MSTSKTVEFKRTKGHGTYKTSETGSRGTRTDRVMERHTFGDRCVKKTVTKR